MEKKIRGDTRMRKLEPRVFDSSFRHSTHRYYQAANKSLLIQVDETNPGKLPKLGRDRLCEIIEGWKIGSQNGEKVSGRYFLRCLSLTKLQR